MVYENLKVLITHNNKKEIKESLIKEINHHLIMPTTQEIMNFCNEIMDYAISQNSVITLEVIKENFVSTNKEEINQFQKLVSQKILGQFKLNLIKEAKNKELMPNLGVKYNFNSTNNPIKVNKKVSYRKLS